MSLKDHHYDYIQLVCLITLYCRPAVTDRNRIIVRFSFFCLKASQLHSELRHMEVTAAEQEVLGVYCRMRKKKKKKKSRSGLIR